MWLRYRNSDTAEWQAWEFDALVDDEERDVVEVKSGVSMRGYRYAHVLYSHVVYRVVISADSIVELDETLVNHRPFLRAFWRALHKQIALVDEPVDVEPSDWIDVVSDGGEEPVEFLEGASFLPEYSFSLTSVAPIED